MRNRLSRIGCVVALVWAAGTGLRAQQSPVSPTILTPVPRVIWFSGAFRPADTRPAAPVERVTVAIYREAEGGDAVWQETQNVAMEANGRYNLLLGSTLSDGVPLDLFTSGEPRWIGITIHRPGETEQPRAQLASVPYSMKAADSDTLGGKPASAYLLAEPPSSPGTPARASKLSTTGGSSTPAGTAGFLGMFVDAINLGNSALFQNGASIGLGTTGPADKFHVAINNSSGASTGYAVQNLSGAANAYSGMLFYDQNGALGQFQGFNNTTHEYRINNIASGGSINFMIGSNSKFLVANNGNIGIGTPAPQKSLHVVGQDVRVEGHDDGIFPRFSLNFTGGFINEKKWQNYATTGRLSFTALNDAETDENFWLLVTRGSGTEILNVSFPNGNVGIGTILPNSTLEVKAGGTTLADAWTVRSSERFKSNIQTIPFALSKVLQLRGVTFDYRETQKHSIGFIAEEIGRVLPEVVEYEANGRDAKGLDYNKLIPVVVEAMKEQQQEIETLTKRLGEFDALKALLCSYDPTAEICKRAN